jgi:hypothetical protein
LRPPCASNRAPGASTVYDQNREVKKAKTRSKLRFAAGYFVLRHAGLGIVLGLRSTARLRGLSSRD